MTQGRNRNNKQNYYVEARNFWSQTNFLIFLAALSVYSWFVCFVYQDFISSYNIQNGMYVDNQVISFFSLFYYFETFFFSLSLSFADRVDQGKNKFDYCITQKCNLKNWYTMHVWARPFAFRMRISREQTIQRHICLSIFCRSRKILWHYTKK